MDLNEWVLAGTRPLSIRVRSGYKYSDLAYFIGSVPNFSNGLLVSSTNKQNPCAVIVNVNGWNEIDMGYVLKCSSRQDAANDMRHEPFT